MGGGYYDRDVIASGDGDGGNDVVGKQQNLNPGLDPKTYTEEQNRIVSEYHNPVVFALDVTGSMGTWPRIIYDKMPMFYGQVKMKDYLKDPAISFCAIGDVTSDQAPLQVTRFGQGKQIDEMIAKLWLEGNGGGNQHESYELSAYFYNNFVKLTNCHMAFFFVTGDEFFYEGTTPNLYQKVLGCKVSGSVMSGKKEWENLRKAYNVFHLKKQYGSKDEEIMAQWVEALGKQRVLNVQTPKACIDVILGAIAITSGARNLKTYIADMEERGQTKQRIEQVTASLKLYAESLESGAIKPVVHEVKPGTQSKQKSNTKPQAAVESKEVEKPKKEEQKKEQPKAKS